MQHNCPISRPLILAIADGCVNQTENVSEAVSERTKAINRTATFNDTVDWLRQIPSVESGNADLKNRCLERRDTVSRLQRAFSSAQEEIVTAASKDDVSVSEALISKRDSIRSELIAKSKEMISMVSELQDGIDRTKTELDSVSMLMESVDYVGSGSGSGTLSGSNVIAEYDSWTSMCDEHEAKWNSESNACSRIEEISSILYGLTKIEDSQVISRIVQDIESNVAQLDDVVQVNTVNESNALNKAIVDSVSVTIQSLEESQALMGNLLSYSEAAEERLKSMEGFADDSAALLSVEFNKYQKAMKLCDRKIKRKKEEIEDLQDEAEDTKEAESELIELKKKAKHASSAFQTHCHRIAIAAADHFPELRADRALQKFLNRTLQCDGLWQMNRSLSQYDIVQSITVGRHPVYKVLGSCGKLLALKEYHVDEKSAEFERFLREAKLLRRADHPSIAKLNTVWVDKDTKKAYIEMPWYNGGNLVDLLNDTTLEHSEQLYQLLMFGVVQGLAHLHRIPILHLDIKPENILIEKTESGGLRAVISDFDISKDVSDRTMAVATLTMKTPYFAAPESVGSTAYDMYQFGLLLFFVHFPNEPMPDPMNVVVPSHPNKDLVDLISKLLVLEPEKRPTADQVLAHPYFTGCLFVDASKEDLDFKEQARKLEAAIREKNRLLHENRKLKAARDQREADIAKEKRELHHMISEAEKSIRAKRAELERITGDLDAERNLRASLEREEEALRQSKEEMTEAMKRLTEAKQAADEDIEYRKQRIREQSQEVDKYKAKFKELADKEKEKEKEKTLKGQAPPTYWETSSLSSCGPVLRYSIKHKETLRGIQGILGTRGYELVSAERVENPFRWGIYSYHRSVIADHLGSDSGKHRPEVPGPVSTQSDWSRSQQLALEANEYYLFCALNLNSDSDMMNRVLHDGFDSHSHVCLAEDCDVAGDGDGDKDVTVLLCRVVLGKPCTVRKPFDPRSLSAAYMFDSWLLMDRRLEFVVRDGNQVYPEYVLRLKRSRSKVQDAREQAKSKSKNEEIMAKLERMSEEAKERDEKGRAELLKEVEALKGELRAGEGEGGGGTGTQSDSGDLSRVMRQIKIIVEFLRDEHMRLYS